MKMNTGYEVFLCNPLESSGHSQEKLGNEDENSTMVFEKMKFKKIYRRKK